MDIEKMGELRRLMYDSNTPLSLRQQAAAKYEKALDEATREFDGCLERIKAGESELGNAC